MGYCEEKGCLECCYQPKVLLLNEDVNRITSNGFYDVYFIDEAEGIKALRVNDDGSCVFFKKDTMQCEIGNAMPIGCSLRPYIISYLTDKPTISIYANCKFLKEFKEDSELQSKAEEYLTTARSEIEWRRKTGYF